MSSKGTKTHRRGNGGNLMSSTGKYDCICGYPGTSRQDLDEHLIAMMDCSAEGDHRPAHQEP